jgi:hypothetical protein
LVDGAKGPRKKRKKQTGKLPVFEPRRNCPLTTPTPL